MTDAASAAWLVFRISLICRFGFSEDTESHIQPVHPGMQDVAGIISAASADLREPRDKTLMIDILHGMEMCLRASLPVQHTYFQQEIADAQKIKMQEIELERQQIRYSSLLNVFPIRWANR